MSMKNIVIGIIVVIIVVLVVMIFANKEPEDAMMEDEITEDEITEDEMTEDEMMEDEMMEGVKDFSLDSFVEFAEDGSPMPQFSVKELAVKKGDTVKINVSVLSGRHDFKIDEFGVYEDTPTGETTTIEFVADQAGEFVYYCNQPGHRAAGQWGTLIVTE